MVKNLPAMQETWLQSLGQEDPLEKGMTAAAAAKLLHSCPTLCDPIDGSPPGFPVPGILQARTLEWVAISFSNQYSILTHIYGIQKDGNDDPVCKTAKETDVQSGLLDSEGQGEGRMIWENGIETYTIR